MHYSSFEDSGIYLKHRKLSFKRDGKNEEKSDSY